MKSFIGLLALAVMGTITITGCGSGSNNNGTVAATSCPANYTYNGSSCVVATAYGTSATSCQGSCAAGQVQTSVGCLTQATQCGVCGGLNGSSCVQGIYTNGTTGYGTTGYGYGTTGYGTTGYGTTGYGYPTQGYGYAGGGYPYAPTYGYPGYGYPSYGYPGYGYGYGSGISGGIYFH